MSHTGPSDPNISRSVRRKTPGACERCREKRIKCDGVQPCDQCLKKDQHCVFTFLPSVGSDALSDKLDVVLSRLDHLERLMNRPSLVKPSDLAPDQGKASSDEAQSSYLAQLNPQTGCVEFYGRTSTFVVASSLGKRVQELEDGIVTPPIQKRLRTGQRGSPKNPGSDDIEGLGLDDLTGFCDYVMPSNAVLRQHRCLRSDVADRHVESFIRTIHIFIPIFDINQFTSKYRTVRSLFGDNRLYVASEGSHHRQHFLCLLYAVLALGALYEDEREDSSSWASWYFAEAQEVLGRLLDAVNLELVQAAMLLGAYAQHAIKPSLAYNLTGIATRLAFSIGLNTESTYGSAAFEAEEARRTWWMLYVQEVELSLDSGRPMSIRTSEMDISYPELQDGDAVREPSQVDFIQPLSEIAKVIRRILKLVNVSKKHEGTSVLVDRPSIQNLQDDLLQWQRDLPTHLKFSHEVQGLDTTTQIAPYSWRARQLSSLRIHYNLALIILLRGFLAKKPPEPGDRKTVATRRQPAMYKSACVDAARDMIIHISDIFAIAPSLRRWSYYCFYCLQATLVLLTQLTNNDSDDPTRPTRRPSESADPLPRDDSKSGEDLQILCERSIRIFDQIELKASKRCAQVVRKFLDRWENRKRKRKQPNQPKPGPNSTVLNGNELPPFRSTPDHPSQPANALPGIEYQRTELTNSATAYNVRKYSPGSSEIRQSTDDNCGGDPPAYVTDADGYSSTFPSAESFDGLQAELEKYSTLHNQSGMNMDAELEMFSTRLLTELGIGMDETPEYLEGHWTKDGNTPFYY